ncbi:MAG: trypsin-like peptidase domain-containing protein [Myxococcales bacterium]|nr:trypsin-like peptidase domain-containing protein [Myxococcales bacterium]
MARSALPLLFSVPLVFALGCKSTNATAEPPKPAGQAETTRAPFATPPVLAGAPDIATLVAKVQPGVVSVVVDSVRPAAAGGLDMFEFFGGRGPRGGDESFRSRSQGSGFIIDKEGHVVTNAHVVDGVTDVRVKLADGRELKASVKGRDPRLDLAVLKIQGEKADFPAAALGVSEAVRVGEYVVAMGNPMGLGHTVTMGIVSAKSRTIGAGPYDDFIQTDASINPGNSGGPLFNLKGEVIAINTAIINPQRAQNIGFAIPVDALKDVLPQLIAKGTVSRGRIGVGFQPVDASLAKALGLDKPKGAIASDVEPGGPADRAGVRSGDIILSVGADAVNAAQDLPRLVAKHAPGSKVELKIQRDRQALSIPITLEELKEERAARAPVVQGGPAAASSSALGVSVDDAPNGGALVRGVTPGSRADGELIAGDVILEVNRARVESAADLSKKVQAAPNSGALLLKVQRNGRTRFVGIER